MKHLTLFILSAVLIISSNNNVSIAQAKDSVEVKANSPQNTFYFFFINGYALAHKFYNSENSDLRLRIDLSSSYSDAKGHWDGESTNYSDKERSENNFTTSVNNVTAEFAYSYNFYRSRLSLAYAGMGPFISFNRTKQESTNKDTYPPNTGYRRIISNLDYGFSAGLSAFIGLEAFLTQNLRVFAETQLTGGRSWSKSEANFEQNSLSTPSKDKSASAGTNSSWSYNFTSVRVGLGISI
ncbi:MAG TPA: hypothetical protein VHO03_18320 [Ignavibacteriales bacterium]|nr:hypothetical protein [Ignavibacteriales bacterium]